MGELFISNLKLAPRQRVVTSGQCLSTTALDGQAELRGVGPTGPDSAWKIRVRRRMASGSPFERSLNKARYTSLTLKRMGCPSLSQDTSRLPRVRTIQPHGQPIARPWLSGPIAPASGQSSTRPLPSPWPNLSLPGQMTWEELQPPLSRLAPGFFT